MLANLTFTAIGAALAMACLGLPGLALASIAVAMLANGLDIWRSERR